MTHEQAHPLLNDYVDGELGARQYGDVERHVAACTKCRVDVEGLRSLRSAVRGLRSDIPPARDLWPGLLSEIHDLRSRAHVLGLLNDYVDGELSSASAAEVADHIMVCVECRTELEALQLLAGRIEGLASEIQPDRDLWSGIRQFLGSPRVVNADFGPGAERRLWRRRAMLAAAAILVAAVSSLTTVFVLNREGTGKSGPIATRELPLPGSAQVLAVEGVYRSAIQELMSDLRHRRGRLAPETRAVIEKSLETIDRAIRESREALDAHPEDPRSLQTIQVMYRKKMELLQQAARLPAGT